MSADLRCQETGDRRRGARVLRSRSSWFVVGCSLCIFLLGSLPSHSQTAPAGERASSSDLLQFLDGSTLHGSLEAVEGGQTLRWRHDAAREPIAFRPASLYRVRFSQGTAPPQGGPATCRLRFANEDQVAGELVKLDEQVIVFDTWFGGRLTAPRAAVRSLHFIKDRSQTFYEGPTSLAEWNTGPQPGAWSYRDGVLTTTAIGSLGRDMNLPARGRIEFDLDWNGQMSLIASIYTDSAARFDFNSTGYMFIFGPGYVTLQRMQGVRGTLHMGQVPVPQLVQKNKAHFEIRAEKEPASLALFVDGALVQQWNDPNGFAGQGTGLAFLSQRVGPALNLSGIRVSNWEGGLPAPGETATNLTQTAVGLVNGDTAAGEVKRIVDGKLELAAANTTLNVPLERVTQIQFPPGQAAPVAPGLVRAELHGGVNVTLQLDRWTPGEVTGQSPSFGRVTLKPEWIRQLVFNLDRAAAASLRASRDEDFFWPFDP
jgi:hypothetical protein